MSHTADYLRRDQAALLHSQHRVELNREALVWARGEGAALVDVNGREYLDGLAGLWNVLVGHGRAELGEVAARQMRTLGYASSFSGATHAIAIELAEKLQVLSYGPDWRFYFTSGGGEALEAAFKTARYAWKRRGRPRKTEFLCCDRAYHGTSFATLSATGFAAYQRMFAPVMPGFHAIPSPRCLNSWRECNQDSLSQAEQQNARHLDDLLNTLEAAIVRSGPERLAGLVAEPVLVAGGMLVPPAGYWPRVRALCDRYELLFIADEVVTAFGRTGPWLALQAEQVTPDLFCLAKGITSGYFPLGALGVSPAIAELIDTAPADQAWWHALTASAHPVGCAVALENIHILERDELLPQAAERALLLRGLLEKHFGKHPQVLEIRTAGLLAGIEFGADRATGLPFPAEREFGARILAAARRRGLISRVRGDTFHLAPPYVATAAQIEQMVANLADSAAEVLAHCL